MRLFIRTPDGLTPVDRVMPARNTILRFEATLTSAVMVDVICLRPDGRAWHLGCSAGRIGSHGYQIELNPFAISGSHVLFVEAGGRRIPGEIRIEVETPRGLERAPSIRRYLGRGSGR